MSSGIARYMVFAYGSGDCVEIGTFDTETEALDTSAAKATDQGLVIACFAEKRIEWDGGRHWDIELSHPVAVFLNGEKWRCVRDE